jgi:hypothetical protein
VPNFKVFSETASQLLAQVSNLTAASLVTQVSNLTAASLLAQMSNLTPASLLVQVSNPTPASLLAQVSNLTATSLLTQVSNLTAASLLTAATLQDRATTDTLVNVADTGDTTFKDTVSRNVLELTDLTFTVINSGALNSAVGRLMLSADDLTYSTDPTVMSQTILPTSQFFFVPGRFTKYAKIQYASLITGLTTSLSIWFQAHV